MSNMQLPRQSSISVSFSGLHKLNIIMQDKQNSKETTIQPWHTYFLTKPAVIQVMNSNRTM